MLVTPQAGCQTSTRFVSSQHADMRQQQRRLQRQRLTQLFANSLSGSYKLPLCDNKSWAIFGTKKNESPSFDHHKSANLDFANWSSCADGSVRRRVRPRRPITGVPLQA